MARVEALRSQEDSAPSLFIGFGFSSPKYDMMSPTVTTTLTVLASIDIVTAASDERIFGAYVFHRHGDRTAKSWTPARLTALGADEVYNSGSYYRSRYITTGDAFRVDGLSSDVAVQSQLYIAAPGDSVLQNSAAAFAQVIYPPTGASETLANGSKVEAPQGGYQYIAISSASAGVTGQSAEASAWLQGSSGCTNAIVRSNRYFNSPEYASTAKRYIFVLPKPLAHHQWHFQFQHRHLKNAYASTFVPLANFPNDRSAGAARSGT